MPTYLISKAQKENKSEDLFYFFEKKSPQNRGFDKDRERDDAFRGIDFIFQRLYRATWRFTRSK